MSGEPATDVCPTRITEWLPADAEARACTWHHASDNGVITVWPAVFRPWAQSAGLLTRASAAVTDVVASPNESSQGPHEAGDALTIIQPLAGALYLYDPTLRSEYQALPLRARGAEGTLEWFVDGTRVGATGGDDSLRWPLVRGSHAVTVRDQSGRSASTRIVVR
jgi:membrane carboxypeptidase/penicillin-binding protein PbpC